MGSGTHLRVHPSESITKKLPKICIFCASKIDHRLFKKRLENVMTKKLHSVLTFSSMMKNGEHPMKLRHN